MEDDKPSRNCEWWETVVMVFVGCLGAVLVALALSSLLEALERMI